MILVCTICSDLIHTSENIYVTQCGHLFHYACLHKWIVRSKSCPQCRYGVTEKRIFRVFPTTSNGSPSNDENVANLQMKLDHAMLNLNQQSLDLKTCQEKISEISTASETLQNSIKTLKERVISKNFAIATQKQQLQYLKTENNQLKKVQGELETYKQKLQVLQGLQKVFNATVEEVESMLEGYPEVRTVATFAIALKKALYESESKRTELRNTLQLVRQDLENQKKILAGQHTKYMEIKEKLSTLTKNYEIIKNKNKLSYEEKQASQPDDSQCLMAKSKLLSSRNKVNDTITNTSNRSLNTLIIKVENSDSPYLKLKQNSHALQALQGPSTSKGAPLLKNGKPKSPKTTTAQVARSLCGNDQELSIFQNKEPGCIEFNNEDQTKSELNIAYDGLGGHASCSEVLPKSRLPKSSIPKLTAKHRLKRPNPAGAQNIEQMLKKRKDK